VGDQALSSAQLTYSKSLGFIKATVLDRSVRPVLARNLLISIAIDRRPVNLNRYENRTVKNDLMTVSL
jgi:hypothetical protein